MSVLLKQTSIIERIDTLTRLKATGPPAALASRLGISKASLTRIIGIMKDMEAPIEYDFTIQSYIYLEEVEFKFGFYLKDI